jgi:hypothetical protein
MKMNSRFNVIALKGIFDIPNSDFFIMYLLFVL